MSDALLMAAIVAVIVVFVGLVVWLRRRPRRIKTRHFQTKWQELQKLCGNKETWAQAITDADKLLDEVLKKKRFSGKTMGERLTGAQRLLTDNEAVWFGHKLRNKLLEDPATKLKERDVKDALLGIRQALKDLGALPSAKIEQAAPIPEVTETKAKPKAKRAQATAASKPRVAARRPAAKAAAPAPKPARRKVVQ